MHAPRRVTTNVLGASLLTALAFALGGASCSGGRPTTPTTETPTVAADVEPAALGTPALRLVVLTDLKGYLEPCGCTSRPLGGIDRLAAEVASLQETAPTLVVAAGDLLFDAPSHGTQPAGAETQEIWKAETLVQILDRVGVEAASVGPLDLRFGPSVLHDLDGAAQFSMLGGGVTIPVDDGSWALPDHVIIERGGLRIGVIGVTDMSSAARVTAPEDLVTQASTSAASARAEGANLVVALVRASRRVSRQIATRVDGIDFVVEGGLDEAEVHLPSVTDGGVIVHAGRQGQNVVVVDVFAPTEARPWADASTWTRRAEFERLEGEVTSLRARIAEWERDPTTNAADLASQRARLSELARELRALVPAPHPTGRAFEARLVELAPEHARDADVQQILAAYDARVNEHNREALASWLPAPAAEGQPHYVGSEACASCHTTEFAWWRSTPHGHAYATLQERHKEFNLSCVGCHVTGYDRPGGSTVSHVGALADVGCENCHGPASQHVEAPSTATVNVHAETSAATCLGCHTPEHSDLFDYELYRPRLIVPGHGLPEGAR